jgi:hypothetical protein
MDLAISGAWFDICGLRNFAVLDFAVGFDLQIAKAYPHPATPRKVFFASTILYKPWGTLAWPAELKTRANGWPLNEKLFALTRKGGPLRQFTFAFLYEQWNADFDDFILLVSGMPRLAVKINIPYLTLTDVISMAMDIVMSVVAGSNGDAEQVPQEQKPFPEVLDAIVKAEMECSTQA